jgi:hypothetical protein
MFALRTYIGGWHSNDDFEIAVKKAPTGATSSGVPRYRMRNVSMTSNGLEPRQREGGRMRQRTIVHEFGHMLSLNDE